MTNILHEGICSTPPMYGLIFSLKDEAIKGLIYFLKLLYPRRPNQSQCHVAFISTLL